jgi:hypothetical protein
LLRSRSSIIRDDLDRERVRVGTAEADLSSKARAQIVVSGEWNFGQCYEKSAVSGSSSKGEKLKMCDFHEFITPPKQLKQ